MIYQFQNRTLRVANDGDIPAIRKLVNAAYKELADQGLNYTATYQDEQVTRNRISKGKAFLIEEDGELIASVLITNDYQMTGKNTAYISQLAVLPSHKNRGLGNLLMDFCEFIAVQEKREVMQLDTAKPAQHLVSWYLKQGYLIIGETQWEGKNYSSYIFEKALTASN